MKMKIHVPEQIIVESGTVSRILRLDDCSKTQEIKEYLQAVKLGYEIEKPNGQNVVKGMQWINEILNDDIQKITTVKALYKNVDGGFSSFEITDNTINNFARRLWKENITKAFAIEAI